MKLKEILIGFAYSVGFMTAMLLLALWWQDRYGPTRPVDKIHLGVDR